MNEQDQFDPQLAALFEQEHLQIPAAAFVTETMRTIRAERRRREITRNVLRVVALVALVAASPWLTSGVARLNAAVESSLQLVAGPPGTWILGGLALVVVAAMRLRRH